jgi:anti-sigma factor RsiW
MKCDEIRERMPDLAAGFSQPTGDEGKHLESCGACAQQLQALRATMALLDQWQAPEPSPYFDVRLQARLREEMAKPEASWLHWFRRPVLAAALTICLAVGVGVFFTGDGGIYKRTQEASIAEPGTAVSDLQALDKNHDMYSDFDLLDDLELQQNVAANP